jgi:hypothetical protein
MRGEETDLSFLKFGREASPDAGQTAPNVSIRPAAWSRDSAMPETSLNRWWLARDLNPGLVRLIVGFSIARIFRGPGPRSNCVPQRTRGGVHDRKQ